MQFCIPAFLSVDWGSQSTAFPTKVNSEFLINPFQASLYNVRRWFTILKNADVTHLSCRSVDCLGAFQWESKMFVANLILMYIQQLSVQIKAHDTFIHALRSSGMNQNQI